MEVSDELRARYEELRRQILQQDEGGRRGEGLALFVRRGMKEWISAWSQCTVSNTKKRQEQTSHEEMIFPDVRSDIVMILTGMVLHGVTRQEHEQ